MLESVFIILLCMGFILLLLGIELKTVLYNWVSILMWIVVLAAYLNIEVPSDTYYQEWTMLPLSLGFIIINIIVIVTNYLYENEQERYRIR